MSPIWTTLSRALLRTALCASALAAQAQGSAGSASPPPAARPDPLDAQAPVPALSYRSAFAPYRKLGDAKPLSWREANEAVARIGGWRAYAREAQPPASAPTTPPAGHGAHKSP